MTPDCRLHSWGTAMSNLLYSLDSKRSSNASNQHVIFKFRVQGNTTNPLSPNNRLLTLRPVRWSPT